MYIHSGPLNSVWQWSLLVFVLGPYIGQVPRAGCFHRCRGREALSRHSYFLAGIYPFRVLWIFFKVLLSLHWLPPYVTAQPVAFFTTPSYLMAKAGGPRSAGLWPPCLGPQGSWADTSSTTWVSLSSCQLFPGCQSHLLGVPHEQP